ncbi:MAG: TrkH family potassium uptake protein [Gomphosphaeria aponina SAG 52.96 = DSM 107014]|uniref:TrkH family potassium uptake protein n=1 Tax=Gomphosphaeria aponina SAG 52.96 = DSM 107014 TaxID=1521640 RepID=A0A941GVD7_9CHRO|nr:TrkH family potassium uptake protein [Gomphosphaeria aponina SAG 52.96 = DSM 107014]
MTISRTICLGFLALIAVGTLLLLMPFSTSDGSWNDPIVALFTVTSAVCVTGLVVVDTGSHFSFWGELIIVVMIQLGGLGYMMITTFLMLLIGRKFDLRQRLAIQDSFDRPFVQGSTSLIRSIIATTLIFEITGILLLLKVFSANFDSEQSLWLAIFHSVSAWNNAGFGLFPDNLMSYRASWLINLVIPGLIIFGGLGYQVIFEMYLWIENRLKNKRAIFVLSLNFKVVISTTFFLLVLGTVAFFLTELKNQATLAPFPLHEKILAAWFQSVVTRTAGFNSIDIGKMTTAGLLFTIGLMFIGASPSGTGGGIKTTTLRIITNCTRSVLQGNENVVIYQREVPNSLILKAVAVVFGSVMTVICVTFIISFLDPDFDSIQILFEVVSAFATVGLSTGITASLSSWAKLLLIITMYIGRVGVLLLMAAILGEPRPSVLQYPEENLLVG